MAENRLLRENNPEPGERRGYVPQHLEAGSQEYSKTEGSDGRLHTKSMIVDQNGEPFEQENPVPVQLTGRVIEHTQLLSDYTDIAAGSRLELFEESVNGEDLEIQVAWNTGGNGHPIQILYEATGDTVYDTARKIGSEQLDKKGDVTNGFYTNWTRVRGNRHRVIAKNTSDTDDVTIRRLSLTRYKPLGY